MNYIYAIKNTETEKYKRMAFPDRATARKYYNKTYDKDQANFLKIVRVDHNEYDANLDEWDLIYPGFNANPAESSIPREDGDAVIAAEKINS